MSEYFIDNSSLVRLHTTYKVSQTAYYARQKSGEGTDYTKRRADENARFAQQKAGEVKSKTEESKSNI